MAITRRDFLKYCTAAATALGLTALDLQRLEAALKPGGGAPAILWLHGSGCQGDSVSFLNRISTTDPAGTRTIDDILINTVDLAYHTVVMASAGAMAVEMLNQVRSKGNYVLVIEGGIPRAFGGRACLVYEENGQPVPIQQAMQRLIPGAAAIVCLGTCAAFGGIPRSGIGFANGPTDIISGGEAAAGSGKPVVNIPGCPAHPDWTTWAIAQLLAGAAINVDGDGRPTALYGANVHAHCPRNPDIAGNTKATGFGQDLKCLQPLGCRGPDTYSDCPSRKSNNGRNWCVDSNGMCLGCVERNFPGGDFYATPY